MPRPRLKSNLGLPERWQFTHGAFYYRVPPGCEPMWDGKKRFRLGKTLSEAHTTFGERTHQEARPVKTIADLLDRYGTEVVLKKAPKTRTDNQRAIKRLRAIFGHWPVEDFKPKHAYEYVDRRRKTVTIDGKKIQVPALTAAHRELEVLSHAFTMAVKWGVIDKHTWLKEVRLDGELALKPRERYVEDWEVVECLSLASRRKAGSVLMIQAYIRLKLLTGLARSDLLRLRMGEHLRADGIHVTRHKTQGRPTIYDYALVPEREAAVEQAKRVRPALSPFLFCNRRGEGYFDEATGECHGWDSMWSRFMDRVLKETNVRQRFTEHDLRAKVGSDAESLEKARALLQHADAATTQRIYRRKPERV
jgi:integrase